MALEPKAAPPFRLALGSKSQDRGAPRHRLCFSRKPLHPVRSRSRSLRLLLPRIGHGKGDTGFQFVTNRRRFRIADRVAAIIKVVRLRRFRSRCGGTTADLPSAISRSIGSRGPVAHVSLQPSPARIREARAPLPSTSLPITGWSVDAEAQRLRHWAGGYSSGRPSITLSVRLTSRLENVSTVPLGQRTWRDSTSVSRPSPNVATVSLCEQ